MNLLLPKYGSRIASQGPAPKVAKDCVAVDIMLVWLSVDGTANTHNQAALRRTT